MKKSRGSFKNDGKDKGALKKTYIYIILIYVIMQFSGIVGFPLLESIGFEPAKAVGWWLFISFLLALLVILYLLKEDIATRHLDRNRSSVLSAAVWSFLGIFLALFAQGMAANIEYNLFGIEPGSENTEQLVEIAKITPIFIVVTSVFGPILEEIIFRKIIFGSLYKRFNFWIAAIISSLFFAVVHWDFQHILIYTAMGITFAFLYVKTNRIIVPIIAHVAMNTLVVLIRIIYADEIEKLGEQFGHMQSFIGGIL